MDKTKSAQLKTLIRQMVNEEIEAIMPDLIGEIKKVIDNRVEVLLSEAKKSQPVIADSAPPSRVTRQKIAEMLGVDFEPNSDTIRASTKTMRTPQITNSTGNKPAEEVVRAITRDYSDLMSKLNQIRPDVKGVYRV